MLLTYKLVLNLKNLVQWAVQPISRWPILKAIIEKEKWATLHIRTMNRLDFKENSGNS